MTFLERLHAIGFASAAGAGGELLLKATAVLAAALVLDFLLHRRMLLACSAAWNGALVLLAVLPIACLALPAKRAGSTAPIATNVASSVELPAVVMPTKAISGSTNVPAYSPEVTIDDPIDEVAEEPAATQVSTLPPAQLEAPTVAAVSATAARWAAILAWAAAAQPWIVPGLVAVYLAGVAVLALRLMASFFAVSRLRRRSQAVMANDWQEQLADWRTRCGLRRGVQLRHSSDVTVPIVIGFLRPAIIVPTDLLESASRAKRDAILAHELAHIVRGDLGWQLLERVIGAILWFHPLAWYTARRIGLVRERICDGFAVHHLGRRNVYVETLLEMATRLTSRRGLSLGLAVLRTSQLGTRLASVQNSKDLQRCQVRPAARGAILVLTAAAALWAGRAAVAVEPVPQVAGLPSDAQQLLAGYEQKSARLQAEVDRQVAAERDALIKSLQALQDDYTKQARLDEAVAIRDQLRLIRAPKTVSAGQAIVSPPVITTNLPTYPVGGMISVAEANGNPISMAPFRKAIGKVLLIEVTGAASGTVWGDSEVCTDDSSLAAAAVQFGVLQPGERGMIKVTIRPGKKNYAGFSRHGVTSSSWDNTNGAYASLKIEAAPAGAFEACHNNSSAAPGEGGVEDEKVAKRIAQRKITLASFVGSTFVIQTTGQVNTGLWGTDQYTHDSSLGAAAVHAGALRVGQTGYVIMEVKPGIPHYRGSTRNGVTSSDWNNSNNSYVTLTFQSPNAIGQESESPVTVDYSPRKVIRVREANEASSDLFRRSVGQTLCFDVTGSTEGYIWGSNPYTNDSSLAAAAVHAGILDPGEQGIVKVHVEPALDNYPGSTQNGVTSQDWNSGGGYVALRISRVRRGRDNDFGSYGRSSGGVNDYLVVDPSMRPGGTGGPKALASQRVLPDPGTLASYSQSAGQTFYFRVTGGTDGAIWGTDVYTNDSMLAMAAVHAGALKAGETGVVKVTMLPALAQYHGSTNNGVTSRPWENDGSYVSYKVERADGLRTRLPATRGQGLTKYDVDGDDAAFPLKPQYSSSATDGKSLPMQPALRDDATAPGAPLGYNTWSDQFTEAGAPPGGSGSGAPSPRPGKDPTKGVPADHSESSDAAPRGAASPRPR